MSAAEEIMIVEHSQEQSLNASKEAGSNASGDANGPRAMGADGPPAVRRRLPDERHSLTHHFSVGGQEGYVAVGLYEDGLPGELFIRMAKEGSTVSGSWILSQQPFHWHCSMVCRCGSCATNSATHGLNQAGGPAIQPSEQIVHLAFQEAQFDRLATPSR